MPTICQDLRYAARMLAKNPGFTAVAVVTLALGIGANTAIFTVVDGVLFRPLPFPQPDRIVQLAAAYQGESDEMDLTAKQLDHLRSYGQLFEHLAGYTDVGFNLATANEAEHIRGMPVSAEYFQVLGVHPALGRDFLREEDQGDGEHVAILSHELWIRRFAGNPSAVGGKVLMDGEAYTVIGVMPAGFDPRASSDPMNQGIRAAVWVPLALVAKTAGSGENIPVIARLRPGASPAQLQSQMDVVTEDFRVRYPEDVTKETVMSFLPYRAMIGAEMRPFLLVLLGAIGFVLLIACANVANLLLAKSGSRGREIAVRLAVGASRWQLLRQLITESILMALAGGALGWALANAGLSSLLAVAPSALPRVSDIRLDGRIFVFTFAVSLVTGVLFGLAPAIYATRTSLMETLKEGEGRASGGGRRSRLRKGLVAAEFALSLVLLTGAGLMIATFAKLISADPGFDTGHVLTVQFWLTGSKYDSPAAITNFYRAVERQIQALPGVKGVGIVAAGLPLERGGRKGFAIAGPKEPESINANYREITREYFAALEVPLRAGRGFTDADSATSHRVVMVNESLARRYFPGRNPIGEYVQDNDLSSEIVGVVSDVKTYLDKPAEPTIFVPASQAQYATSKLFEDWFPRSIVAKTAGDPLALGQSVREAVAGVDPLVAVGAIRSMDQVLTHSLALRSFMMFLLSLFGGLALFLAGVGIYGVIAYAVSQRTREIGVRMAMGAKPAEVLTMVLWEGLKLVLTGLVFGVAAALMLMRLLEGLVYGVSMRDPRIFITVNLLMLLVALVACYVPARRAARVDPLVALRYE